MGGTKGTNLQGPKVQRGQRKLFAVIILKSWGASETTYVRGPEFQARPLLYPINQACVLASSQDVSAREREKGEGTWEGLMWLR